MIWGVLALIAAVLAAVIYSETDWAYGSRRMRLTAGVCGWSLAFTALVLFAMAVIADAPAAQAYPTCDGGYLIGSPFGGYCDGIPETTGQHWHCQWGFGFSVCEWRWADNTPAPNPYEPQVIA